MDKACPGRDQIADDDVFLQAKKRVGRGSNRRACQHLDGMLEGGSREEGVRAQGGLGHAQQDFGKTGRLLVFSQALFVDALDLKLLPKSGSSRPIDHSSGAPGHSTNPAARSGCGGGRQTGG